MRRSIDPMWALWLTGSRPKPAPRTIVSMSLRLAIPRRVGLHQSPLLLHQPRTILEEMRVFEKEKPFNSRCDTFKLSHRRGSPHLMAKSYAYAAVCGQILVGVCWFSLKWREGA